MTKGSLSASQPHQFKPLVLGSTIVPPRKMTKLAVGPFPATEPLPELEVDVEQGGHEALAYMSSRHHDPEGQSVIFLFENYGDKGCLVVVKTA